MRNEPNFTKSQIVYNAGINKELQRKIDDGHLVKTNPNEPNSDLTTSRCRTAKRGYIQLGVKFCYLFVCTLAFSTRRINFVGLIIRALTVMV